MSNIAIIGCGAWGTSMGQIVAENEHNVTIWCHDSSYEDSINQHNENTPLLPGIPLNPLIKASTNLTETITWADAIIIAVASPFITVIETIAKDLSPAQPIMTLTKGLRPSQEELITISHYIESVIPNHPKAVLSGPNLAKELAQKQPGATVIASREEIVATFFQALVSNSFFRAYTTKDVLGVELGGVIKNVIAIAAGVADNLNLGHNAKAALITRGLAEISRFATTFGASSDTLNGLSGLGDLIVTCSSSLSRNWKTGKALVDGTFELKDKSSSVSEGVFAAKAVHTLASHHNIEMPISSEVYAMLYENKPAHLALESLMARTLKSES